MNVANYFDKFDIIEKHSISGIDKMQYFLYQDFKYQVFKITNKVKSNF